MEEIVRINLDNEMDLILAHKRTMKISELCGMNIAAQTTFATAVSEIARCAITHGENSYLTLNLNPVLKDKKEIVASLFDSVDLCAGNHEAFSYARRLMGDLESVQGQGGLYEIKLKLRINFSGTITPTKVEAIRQYFKNESPISPYDEIRKKNIQLIDLASRLQESEKQYQILTDTLPLMMFSIDDKGSVNYSNQGLKDYFGEDAMKIKGMSWQAMVHPEDYKNIWQEWDRSQSKKTAFKSEGRLKDKNDKFLWHLISIVPVKNEQDQITTWIGFFVDIHSQKQVEETLKDNKELKRARESLERYQSELEQKIAELNNSNQSLEQFAYIASHDLQEPLRKIITFSNLLEEELKLNENQSRYFEKIKSTSQRMSVLIKDVLAYSTLSTNSPKFKDVDLAELFTNVLADFEMSIQKKGAKVTYKNLPVARVIPMQITQLFANLLSNSLKFSNGNAKIEVSSSEIPGSEIANLKELDSKQSYFHIKFEDNGIGFDQEFADKIFTIFQRLQDSEAPGTGIGLAICRKIMNNHRGSITATAKLNEGACFNIYLPVS